LRHGLPKSRLTGPDISAALSFRSKRFRDLEQPSAANQGIHLLQLLLYLGPMLKKHFFNPLSQVHERFNSHP
jgi:hypothetical protein